MKRDASAFYDSDEVLVAEAAEDYCARLRKGEQPEIEEYAARYPAVADLLRQVLPALGTLEPSDLDAGGDGPRTIGDFRIRRELGRGGMGVVYEAEQVSLQRHVALKVLPFAAVMDPRQLQRFKNEAQAAAHLHHTHIVPVYSIGCERGVHYYAMQYIEGPTVAELIEQLRDVAGRDMPGSSASALEAITKGKSTQSPQYCRGVARLGIQAAEALDHAHQQGVVHRDIKPANLIVDAGGHLWITDFGLASFTSHPGLTMTGDLVGTVRYMSPEQALAKRVPVDHRTDIYSLGITLYELLTLERAFQGDDPHKVIQEIAFKEPKPASGINPAVPDELETILIKAVAKDPAERYDTAQELADDLSRFLDHKPITAKRPGLVKRAGKWARRHKALVGGALVALLITIAGLLVSTLLATKAYRREADERARAEDSLEIAIAALDRIYLNQGTGELRPGIPVALLADGVRFYEVIIARNERQVDAGRMLARAHLHAGLIYDAMLKKKEAERALGQAARLLRDLVAEESDSGAKADLFDDLGHAALYLGDFDEAVDAFGAAVRLQPDVARLRYNFARGLNAKGRFDEAMHELQQVLVLVPEHPYALHMIGHVHLTAEHYDEALHAFQRAARADPTSVTQFSLGEVHAHQGRHDEATESYREAVRLAPNKPYYRLRLAASLFNTQDHSGAIDMAREVIRLDPDLGDAHAILGNALFEAGRPEEALAALREAERLGCARTSRPVLEYRIGVALGRLNRTDEAIAQYRKAIELDPEFGDAHHNLGLQLLSKRDMDSAVAALRRACELQPENANNKHSLGAAFCDYVGDYERAKELFREAIELEPDNATFRVSMGNALAGNGEFGEAEAEYREAQRLDPLRHDLDFNLSQVLFPQGREKEALEALRRCLGLRNDQPRAWNNLAWLLATARDETLRNHDAALAAAERAVELAPNDWLVVHTLGVAHYRNANWTEAVAALEESMRLAGGGNAHHALVLAMAKWQLGQKSEARRLLAGCVGWIQRQARADPELERFRAEAEALMNQ